MSAVVVGSDGSIAVSATSDMSRPDSAESTVNLYASDGTAIRTLRLGAEAANRPFAYDGQIIALWQSGEIRVLNSSGRPIARFTPTPGGKPARDWPLAIAAQGRRPREPVSRPETRASSATTGASSSRSRATPRWDRTTRSTTSALSRSS